jgi:hypothetical protein
MLSVYQQILRVAEGEKALARNANKFFTQRDKLITSDVKTFRNVVIDVENQILQDLKNLTLNDWKINRLNQILNQLNVRVDILNQRAGDVLTSDQIEVVQKTNIAVAQNVNIVKGNPGYFTPTLSEELFLAMETMSSIPLSGFSADLRTETANIIRMSLLQNKSVTETIDTLQKRFGKSQRMGYARAEAIARTELLRAQSMAQYFRGEQIADLNPDMMKSWVHSDKVDRRQGHVEAEQKYKDAPIEIRGEFKVRPYGSSPKKGQAKYNKYEYAKYPRDPQLSAANTVNCGCGMIYVTKRMIEEREKI